MALILARLLQSPSSGAITPGLSVDLTEYSGTGYPGGVSGVSAMLSGSVVSNLPVSVNNPRTLSGYMLPTFADDFYDRIHIQPTAVNFGNVSTPQTAAVEIWNAFRQSVDLTAIDGTETGLSISEPITVPGAMAPLASRVWTITVTKDGMPELDTALVWQFDAPALPVSVSVTATRIATWPFKPLTPLVEALEWSTEVLRPKAGEQRICKRPTPRRTLTLEHAVRQDQAAHARTLARQDVRYLAPDWPKMIKMIATTGASVSLPDGAAIVWRDWNDYEKTTITGGVLGSVVNPGAAIVAPLAVWRVVGATQLDRPAGQWAKLSITLETPEFTDTESAALYPVWQSLPVVSDPIKISSGSFGEDMSIKVETFDNGQCLPVDEVMRNSPDLTFNVRWHEFKADRIAALRAWIASRRGRLRAFWLPSWAHDLKLVARSSGGMIVTGYDGDETSLAVNIGGTLHFRQVTSASTVGTGTQLVLDSELPAGEIKMISYLRRVRFNTDRIEYNHAAGAGVSVGAQVVEVSA